VEIRTILPEEYGEVGRLTAQVYLEDGFLEEDHDYVLELTDTPRRARDAEVWVAVDVSPAGTPEGGRVLGSVTFCPVGSAYREIARDDEGEFRMLVVSPAARGRGVGRALVELCLRRSRELGYVGIRMSTMERMTAAHRVYERLGFTRAPEDDWSPSPGVTLLAYAAPLVPGDHC
jgi:ribosomal protein S18 acetylase RimI-like enzyme